MQGTMHIQDFMKKLAGAEPNGPRTEYAHAALSEAVGARARPGRSGPGVVDSHGLLLPPGVLAALAAGGSGARPLHDIAVLGVDADRALRDALYLVSLEDVTEPAGALER